MKDEDISIWIYAAALYAQRKHFVQALAQYQNTTLVVDKEHAMFLLELVLGGNYDTMMMHHMFALEEDLIERIRFAYRN